MARAGSNAGRSSTTTVQDLEFAEALLKVEPGVRSRLSHLAREMGLGDIGDDICQDTLLRAWRERANYAGRPGTTPYTFLFTIGYRQLIDAQRKKKRRKVVRLQRESDGSAIDVPDRSISPLAHLEAEECQRRVQKVLATLKPRDVAVWELVQSEHSYDEAAQELGLTRGAVGTIMHRIRRKLKTALV